MRRVCPSKTSRLKSFDVIVIGGGAAGYFTSINVAEMNPDLQVIILERGKEVLTKVKVSGGGRCNVTHAEFEPKELSQNYPRGGKELLGPFHTFMTGDTIDWFEKRGVELKIEMDGRMFPTTDSSQTIIDCFISETERLGIVLMRKHAVKNIEIEGNHWKIETPAEIFTTKKLVIATGSNPKIWNLMEKLGHTIVSPVPSLFTFNIDDERIKDLSGIATDVSVKILNEKEKVQLESTGPILITHWGISGPAILRLSAWGARVLEPTKYHFTIKVNWLADISTEDTLKDLLALKALNPKKTVHKYTQFGLPKRLWQNLVKASMIMPHEIWAEISKKKLQQLAMQLTSGQYEVKGKSTFKEEFVTAGGVDLKEVDFRTFQSKLHNNLYFAGEVLNIDAITGGFNFQNAWTGGFMVAKAITA